MCVLLTQGLILSAYDMFKINIMICLYSIVSIQNSVVWNKREAEYKKNVIVNVKVFL